MVSIAKLYYFVADEHRTKESHEIESSIINEMMEIVAKRDSLIALLEEDRLRCFSKRMSVPHLSVPTNFCVIDHHTFPITACVLCIFAFVLFYFVLHITLLKISYISSSCKW